MLNKKPQNDYVYQIVSVPNFGTLESCFTICYNHLVTAPKLVTERGGLNVEIVTSLIITIVAGVISHLICKWLDGDE